MAKSVTSARFVAGHVVSDKMDKTISVELTGFDPPAVRQGRAFHSYGQGP